MNPQTHLTNQYTTTQIRQETQEEEKEETQLLSINLSRSTRTTVQDIEKHDTSLRTMCETK